MTEKGAGVDSLPARRRPSRIHQIRAAYTCREWKSPGQSFAKANQIGNDGGMLTGKPLAGSTKTGVDLVENEQHFVLVT
jgi:hypothetical protein